MRAVRMHSFGDPDVLVLEDVERPEPAAGEVLVSVKAAGVNPVDSKTRSGQALPLELPAILGWDLSGVVEALGPGAHGVERGDEVFGMIRFPSQGAAYAEYVTAPVEQLAPKPASLDHRAAAGVPLVALTAWQALFEAGRLEAGQTALVHAAAGGVGHIAVQLARWKGARVIGTASAANHDYLRELGADEVIDYTTTPFDAVVRDVDLVLDSVAGETRERSWAVLRRGGVLVSILGQPDQETAERHGVRAEGVLVRPDGGQLREIARLIDEGALRPTVDVVVPLAEARRAHELIASGHTRGKIVLDVDAGG